MPSEHRVPTLSLLPLRVAKTGKNRLNEEINPLLSTGIGERFSQTISNLGHAALLRRWELPPINESAELTQGALWLILYSEHPSYMGKTAVQYKKPKRNTPQESFTIKYL